MEFKEKTAVVVGATGGMGKEVSRALYKEGVRLVIVARTEDKLKALSAQFVPRSGISPCERDCDYYVCDLNKPESISSLCIQIIQKYPSIDLLLNAAGIGVYKSIEETTESDWMDSFNVNVTASFYFTKYLLPSLKNAEKALVFNFGSGMGVIPTAGRSVYCMTKSALRGLSLSLSKEFEGTKISIIHLNLGSVLTDFGPLTLAEKKEESLQGKAYLTPQSVADKIVSIIKAGQFQEEIILYPTDYSK